LDLLEATLRVEESKSEEGERLIALPKTLVNELVTHYSESTYRSDVDYVFAHPERGSKLDSMWYAREFPKALEAAGITDHVRPFHDARHGALTHLAAAGVSPIAIMGIAGHRSMQTTKQYVHLAGVVFRDEAAALEARLLGVESSGRKSPKTASLSDKQLEVTLSAQPSLTPATPSSLRST
jgi:integrase